ncbi:MAG TPA: branched-chain amino acid ABC transporter substrate-binding protein [Rhizobacter sp.]|nr:branched-chain amino acid ABC transporter substrate-binding protein [Rhizobacter sp.]
MKTSRFVARCLAGSAMVLSFSIPAAEVIKIGFIDVLSGPFAAAGTGSLQQLREVVLQVNAKSGPNEPKFEVVPFDNKGSPQESATVLKAASDQGIRYITQGGGSGVAFVLVDAINKMAERDPKLATVYLNYSAMDPGLTNDRCSFWHFRFYPSSEMQMEGLTSYLKGKPEVKKVFLFNQNYTHGQQVSRAAREYLARKRPDIQVVGDDFVPIAQVKDFSPYIAKIKASGADTVITSNWGSDLGLFFKAAKDAALDVHIYTLNANNPGIPSQLGTYGAGKVAVIWNSGSNVGAPELEKLAAAYRKKYNEDFIFAAHWNGMHMLQEAMRRAKSTDPKAVAFAMEGATFKSPLGEIEMRKTDHQLQSPIFLGVWDKQDGKRVKVDSEGTGYGFRSEAVWDSYISAQPTSCQMKRPAG